MNMIYPENKDFIFSIFDDTDVATLGYIRPIYDFLESVKMFTTKSVWPNAYYGKCNDSGSHVLEDEPYAEYIKKLDKSGFEIGFHGPTMVSSKRDKIEKSFKIFKDVIGKYPRIYAAHSKNRENLYWGKSRFSCAVFRKLYSLLSDEGLDYFQGHKKETDYFWGDLALKHIDYVRNFTYNEINLLNISRLLPYSNRKTPWVKHWFFTCDADNVEEFNHLISVHNQEKLVREHGICIVTTHFGKGFLRNGKLHPETKRLLTLLSTRNGWFAPVSTVLDYLKNNLTNSAAGSYHLFLLELRWFIDAIFRRKKRKDYEKTEISYLLESRREL